MPVTLREIPEGTIPAVRVTPEQERFVSSVQSSLRDAARYPQANPWHRTIHAGDEPVGFVMVSWNVVPQPPDIIGPWFLWKLLIDHRHQGKGYGAEAVRQVAALIRAEGATELLTSYVDEPGGPAGFYERLGFTPTGDRDEDGEIIVALDLVRHGLRP